jgi:hypothetical protein
MDVVHVEEDLVLAELLDKSIVHIAGIGGRVVPAVADENPRPAGRPAGFRCHATPPQHTANA